MKHVSALKQVCRFCQMIRRGKNLFVYCKVNVRHKQKQGWIQSTKVPGK
eukprot:gene6774-7874_t